MVEWRREGRGEECCGWCGCSCKGRGQGENEVGERERKWMNVRTRVIDIRRCPALLPHVCVIGMNKRSKDQMEGSTVVHDTTTARTRASTTPRPRFSPPSWALDPLVFSPIPTRPFGFSFPHVPRQIPLSVRVCYRNTRVRWFLFFIFNHPGYYKHLSYDSSFVLVCIFART